MDDSREAEGASLYLHAEADTARRSPHKGGQSAALLRAASADQLAVGARRAALCLSMAYALAQLPCPSHRPIGRPGPCLLGPGPWAEEACLLAELLARGAAAPTAALPVEVVGSYIEALGDAASAVYFCRRLRHPHHRCWFDPAGNGGDLCGRVLALAHDVRLSPA